MRDRKKKVKRLMTVDEDDIPLKRLKLTKDPNSYDTLILPSKEPCELCDRVSKNRYSSIIHNVRHIIIPLLNQTVHQCDICLHHFTSQTDLIKHKSKKHTLYELLTQTDLTTLFKQSTDLITIIKRENEIFKSENAILNNENTILNNENTILKKDNPIVNNNVIVKEENVNTFENGMLSLKNRLMFEDDIDTFDSEKVLNDLTTECHVKVELFPPIWNVGYTKSIHYEELVKPGVFRCKKCIQTFPTRFEAIKHESQHIIIKNSQIIQCTLCNLYLLGDKSNLKRHILISHADVDKPQKINKDITKKKFGDRYLENNIPYIPVTLVTATMKLCEMCFAFCRNRGSHHYVCIGELSEIGKRLSCQKCHNKFFEIKLVKRAIWRCTYKCPPFAKKTSNKTSNETRLKIICQRIKMMNKIYIFCFIFTNSLTFYTNWVAYKHIIIIATHICPYMSHCWARVSSPLSRERV